MGKTQEEAKPPSLFVMKFNKALHVRSAFSCGFKPIDNFLKSLISEQIKNNLVTVWVAIEDSSDKPPVKGFYALNAHSISQTELPDLGGKTIKENIPAIYLNALAVDESGQGRGIGTALMVHAIKKSVEFSKQIGCAVIILDMLVDGDDVAFARRVDFYQMLGFKNIKSPDYPYRMYLSIADAKASL